MRELRSVAVGVSTFGAECVAIYLALMAFSGAVEVFDTPGSLVARNIIAASVVIFTAAAALGLLALVPLTIGRRFGANSWLSLAIAGTLTGAAAYWILLVVSIINDCAVNAALPFTWVDACSHSA